LVLRLIKWVCKGLSEAHHLGVIHRDLKPQNVMIDRSGNVRIMDFGLARSLKGKGITGAGIMLGTPEYMSPEQAETKNVDHRTDIYSFGVILYEMATGRLPFEGETVISIAMKHKSEAPQDPAKCSPQIPGELSQVILKCLEKDPENRYQSARDIYDELAKIEQGFPTTERVIPRKTPITSKEVTVHFTLRKLMIPALLAAAVIVIGVIVWQLFLKKEVVPFTSDKPSLAVMYFKNNTGDTSLEHWRSALSDLLITDLSQSQYLRVLSAESLFNILRQLGQDDKMTYSSDVLKEIAARGNVEKILIGNYTRAADTFRINITLQDGQTGELMGSESVEGVGEKSFYAMVDELTRKIKMNFEFSKQEIATDIDKEVMTITTSSPEAYKYYSEGRKLHLEADYMKSLAAMQKALNIDPEFAMAYRSVAMSYSNMNIRPAMTKAMEKAFELRHRLSERERYIIEGDYFRMSWRTIDRAILAYQNLLKLYPEDTIGNTNLGIIYMETEEWDKAIEHFKLTLANSPESQIGFWNISEAYAAMGLYDKAIESIEDYIRDHPDHSRYHSKIASFLLYQGEYERAFAELDKAESFSSTDFGREWETTWLRGHAYFLKGNFSKAEEEYLRLQGIGGDAIKRSSLAMMSLLKGQFEKAKNQLLKKPVLVEPLIFIYFRTGEPEKALQALDEVWDLSVGSDDRFTQIRILHAKGLAFIELGSLDEALSVVSELKKLLREWINTKDIRFYHHLMGMIALEKGEVAEAVNSLEMARDLLYAPNEADPEYHPLFLYSLAKALYKFGKLVDAEKECLKIISLAKGRFQSGDIYVKSFYTLGKICVQRGLPDKAKEYYTTFLELWRDADPDLPEVEDAKKSLIKLK